MLVNREWVGRVADKAYHILKIYQPALEAAIAVKRANRIARGYYGTLPPRVLATPLAQVQKLMDLHRVADGPIELTREEIDLLLYWDTDGPLQRLQRLYPDVGK